MGDSYKTVLRFDNFDWCSGVANINKVAKKNKFMKPFVRDIKKLVPRLFEPCPLEGLIKLINIASAENILSVLPHGEYIFGVIAKDELVKKFDFIMEMKFFKVP